jgi:hypothetical protein
MDRTHAATTIRQPAYAELLIDSMDRFKNGFPDQSDDVPTSSKWTTQLNNYVLNGYFYRLAVTQIQFQWNLPTIIPDYNDNFEIVIDTGTDAGPHIIELTADVYYTPTELAAEIQSKLQTEAPASGFTCVFAEGVFQITATEDWNMSGTAEDIIQNRCRLTLGFLASVGIDSGDTYYGMVPTMLPTRFIDIHSAYISKFQDVKDSSTSQNLNWQNKIARVYACPPSNRIEISANGGFANPYVMTIDYATPKQIMWNPDEALNNFTLELRDEFGQYVPYKVDGTFGYGCEYAMTLLASET